MSDRLPPLIQLATIIEEIRHESGLRAVHAPESGLFSDIETVEKLSDWADRLHSLRVTLESKERGHA